MGSENLLVSFKPGTYLTGSLFLESGITFEVPEGVTLIGSEKLEDYPELPTRIAGIEMTWPAALINTRGQHNITSDIEIIPIQQINEAYDRLLKSDVKYRFVIDMASLKS